MVPSHVIGFGTLVITGVGTGKISPQLLVMTGGVGATAKEGQETVAAPFAGTVKGTLSMVYTKLHVAELPSQSVYVYAYVLLPSQVIGLGTLVMTGPEGVSISPQLLVTTGKVGATANAGQDTVAAPLVGTVKGILSMV